MKFSRYSASISTICTNILFLLLAATAIFADGIERTNIQPLDGNPNVIYGLQTQQGATFTVTRSDDRNNPTCVPGDCTLREAVNSANSSPTDDKIVFASGLSEITLTNEIVINNNGRLSIEGPGAQGLTIHGNGSGLRGFYLSQADVTISGVTLSIFGGAGSVYTGFGGAIFADGGSLTLSGVNINHNVSYSDGGGVYFQVHDGGHNGTNRIINSTISANHGYNCGGFSSDGVLLVVNSTIAGNDTVQFDMTVGGGLCSTGDTTLRNVTLTGNTSDIGGGIASWAGQLDLGNTIVAGNRNNSGPNCYCFAPELYSYSSTVISAGGNLVGDVSGNAPNLVYKPNDILDVDPLLSPLQDNGGPVPTRVPLAGSPVVDKGLNTLVSPLAFSFDQRGASFSRIRDGNGDGSPTVDIGAVEYQSGATGSRPSSFDFDGDGRADVSVYRPSDRTWYIDRSQAGFAATQFGLATDKMAPADYDGDGKADVAVYRPSEGNWYILNTSNSSLTVRSFGTAEDVPVPGDFDGDGKDDVAVFRPSTGTWWMDRTTAGTAAVQYGLSGDIPVTGDFDGDGTSDIAVIRQTNTQPANLVWYVLRSTAGESVMNWGLATDKLVPADYDGDGKIDIAVYRPSEGAWYIVNSSTGQYSVQLFGSANDIPVPADYDGDGKADTAIFRPTTGAWWMNRTTAGVTISQFGLSGDKPIPNNVGN